MKIYILNGSEKGQSFEIEGDTIHVGRSSANDIKLKDKSISRRHLRVRMNGDTYYVKDLKSTNGTVVQGLKIATETEVEVAQGVPIAIWGGRRPDQMEPISDIFGWSLDLATPSAVDSILAENVKDPVGPEFMAPPTGLT